MTLTVFNNLKDPIQYKMEFVLPWKFGALPYEYSRDSLERSINIERINFTGPYYTEIHASPRSFDFDFFGVKHRIVIYFLNRGSDMVFGDNPLVLSYMHKLAPGCLDWIICKPEQREALDKITASLFEKGRIGVSIREPQHIAIDFVREPFGPGFLAYIFDNLSDNVTFSSDMILVNVYSRYKDEKSLRGNYVNRAVFTASSGHTLGSITRLVEKFWFGNSKNHGKIDINQDLREQLIYKYEKEEGFKVDYDGI